MELDLAQTLIAPWTEFQDQRILTCRPGGPARNKLIGKVSSSASRNARVVPGEVLHEPRLDVFRFADVDPSFRAIDCIDSRLAWCIFLDRA